MHSVMGIATIHYLLSFIRGEYQEIELITQLTNYFNFDHHFFLLESNAATDRYIGTQMYTPQTVYVSERISENFGLENGTQLNSKNAFLIVAPGSSKFEHSLNLLREMKKIQRFRINIKIGVFFTQHTSTEELYKFFEWCKEHLIINVFATTNTHSEATQVSTCPNCRMNIFTFNHFGTFDVINVTGCDTYAEFFPSLKPNFNRHRFRVNPLDAYDDTNFNAFVWRTALELMNATFVFVEIEYSFASEGIAKGIDIVTGLWGIDGEGDMPKIYPMEFKCHVVIVPEALPFSDFSTYIRNATSKTFFGYSLTSIVTVVMVLGVLRYLKRKKILFLQSTADVLNLLINENGLIKYQRLYRVEVFVIVPLTFVGFIVTNGIISNLQSFITRPVLQHQIETLEEIYGSPFPIFVWHENHKHTLVEHFSKQTGYNAWDKRIIANDWFWAYLEGYNRTTVFALEVQRANYVINIQKHLNIKGFHKTPIKILSNLFAYTVSEKFLFFDRMNEIIHSIQSGGLFSQWVQISHKKHQRKIVKINLPRLRDQRPIENVEFPTMIVYGWFASSIVFILEIICSKIAVAWGSRKSKRNAFFLT